MEHHAAEHLDVVMAHVEPAAASLAADGKSLDQQVVERFTGGQSAAEIGGLLPSSASLMAWNLGSRALMASTFGCNRLIYRALLDPNSDVSERSKERPRPPKMRPMISQIRSRTCMIV